MATFRVFLLSLCLGLAAASGAAATSATATPTGWLEEAEDRARDCVGDTSLHDSRPDAISFTVWCGTESGRARFTLRRAREGRIEDFSKRLAVGGAGAVAPFRCFRTDEVVRCIGRKQGPVKVQGWVTVEEDRRCSAGMGLDTGGFGGTEKPRGCPGAFSMRPSNIRRNREFRQEHGLDPDLHGDQAAIDQRIRELIQAWRRGDPVARYTQANWGVPLRARDQRELDFRLEYHFQFSAALGPWVQLHAQSTYAGSAIDHEQGGTIFLGFVGDQQAQIEAFLDASDFLAPDRVRPFPVPPKYSMAYLADLQEQIWRALGRSRLANRIGIDVFGNFVKIHTEDVDAMQRFVTETYGPEAPVVVVFGRPPEPKTAKARSARFFPGDPED
jgi:hypothetical protein